MIREMPYSELKKDKRAYEMMLLRDWDGSTYANIAKEYGITHGRVVLLYNRVKNRQIRFYLIHIANALGHKDTLQIRKIYERAYECYQDKAYACAYLEKRYQKILEEYREGEPGMHPQFMKNMPPFRVKWRRGTIERVIQMREVEKASFPTIARALQMTREKARHTYEWFYHTKVLELIKAKEKEAKSAEEKQALWQFCFKGYQNSKDRYDALNKK